MEHHVARDLLAGYAEGTLEPETREALEEHLSSCEECKALLSEEQPLELPSLPPPPPWTERRVVRTARRALFRAALYAILFYLFLGIPLIALASNAASAVVERAGRAILADSATHAMASLFVPGGKAQSISVRTGFLNREYSVRVARRIGGINRAVAEFTTQLTPFKFRVQAISSNAQDSFGREDFVDYFNPANLASGPNRDFRPGVLPDGSVITVQLFFLNGLSLEEAQGFLREMGCGTRETSEDRPLPSAPSTPSSPQERGAPTAVAKPKSLRAVPTVPLEMLPQFGDLASPQTTWIGFGTSKEPLTGYSSVGGLESRSYVGADPGCSVSDALETVTSQLSMLTERRDIARLLDTDIDRDGRLLATINALQNQPRVVTAVVTGPTRSVEVLLERRCLGGFETPKLQLDQDLYNY